MEFAKTTVEDFTILKNGVDDRLEIIQHVDTEFFNITKMAKLVSELKRNDEATRIRAASEKRNNEDGRILPGCSEEKYARKWFVNQDTTELIVACQQLTGLNCVRYELAAGIPKRIFLWLSGLSIK